MDGEFVIAVLPASRRVDLAGLQKGLGASTVEIAAESELKTLFAGCEVGAEPPFGRLYGLPVVVDEGLITDGEILVRAGSLTLALRIPFTVFERLENPRIASFAVFHDAEAEAMTSENAVGGGAG